MTKCSHCGKRYDGLDDEICSCGGGIVDYSDENFESWANEHDSDGF